MRSYGIAIPDSLNEELKKHLLRADSQEDLCFALWMPSTGLDRTAAVIKEVIYPLPGERSVHGNASFEHSYFERVIQKALDTGLGIAFMHSHVGPGWQDMSIDDIRTERSIAGASQAASSLPLVGMTLGTDGTWSARFWNHRERAWCEAVRIVGDKLTIYFNDALVHPPKTNMRQVTTVSAWGEKRQADLTRLRIGVVGCGSVGGMVAESLARMGVEAVSLIDFDNFEIKNLDRSMHAYLGDVGRAKVNVIKKRLEKSATADNFRAEPYSFSICEEYGYMAALDCDIIFSCVDRPWPRQVLNHLSYANLIPVIDGGLVVEPSSDNLALRNVYWGAHTVGPDKPCLLCIRQFSPSDVLLEQEGFFERQDYIKNVPSESVLKSENVFTFSMGVAAAEMRQLLSLLVTTPGRKSLEPERFAMFKDSVWGVKNTCAEDCFYRGIVGLADRSKPFLKSTVKGAEDARKSARRNKFIPRFLTHYKNINT